ncbi:TetM/TetW/TetO/TetS family tetracycline resistance ribosomal protection protein [Clostridium sp. MSJ-11]|uniref:TetM/TetW/TetO/TetS family tetracycline resistance ribosomal protection protein n=1 Tax=Clostridium mobile TaxID=2841512 RepID=A0ABS6EG11_9CLOT|nr:TetM/TetW/TetO/TetS family tetracycline resistance ribosomal protection protein [Clostridium mobile]MBU5483697.1 TetM/TetW/TetO/TetS family tetracycline resistance ribosomal protection protein [Clostridium mobile]
MAEGLNIRNIGILAHVDAGKTTLTEQMLYKSGVIRELGSVDKGTAHTDSLEVEQQRGISVKASEANFKWKDVEINIIDTPGHIDFSAEVERSLALLDGAVLVVSAVEGVQPQTEVYFKALKTMKVPTIIFINKIDRIGADVERVLGEIRKLLTEFLLPMEIIKEEESSTPSVDLVLKEELKNSIHFNKLIEILAERDEDILEKYLEDEEITFEFLKEKLSLAIEKCNLYPVIYGAALKGTGIEELLDLLVESIPSLCDDKSEELSAIVYKIKGHKNLGKLAYIRLYSGQIESRDAVYNHTKDVEEKVTQIKRFSGQKEINCGKVSSGEIACISGLSKASIGDILGNPFKVPKTPSIAKPLLTIQVFSKIKEDYIKLVEALQELQEEDPLLNLQWIKEKNEIHIQIMGMIQLEILESILKSRFNIEVTFGKPSIIYKETPCKNGIGFEAYTMPKPCWAVVKFEIEPLPRGSGLVYESKVRTEDIKLRYQREIESQLPIALKQGLYGWEVMDLKVTLLEGEDHVMHSNPGDFIIATTMGIMNGLASVGTTLLEPIISFRISVPEEVGGKVLNDIIQMRGSFDSPLILNGVFTVEGQMPIATSLDYPIRLGIISSGKGIMSTKFLCYSPIASELGCSRERVGVNPLDRAKYILYARNAIK